jgi:hypothetical protein
MPREPGKEDSWSHSQERTHCRNTHYRSDGEVCAGYEMRADAISDQEIEDDYIEQRATRALLPSPSCQKSQNDCLLRESIVSAHECQQKLRQMLSKLSICCL